MNRWMKRHALARPQSMEDLVATIAANAGGPTRPVHVPGVTRQRDFQGADERTRRLGSAEDKRQRRMARNLRLVEAGGFR
jgi:hypothetical protein